MDLEGKLAAARAARKPSKTVFAVLGDDDDAPLLELKFYKMDGTAWADEQPKHPLDVLAPMDRNYGYSVTGMSLAAAKLSGVLVENGEESKLTSAQWDEIFTLLAGGSLSDISSTVWELNVWEPSQAVERAKKALRGRLPKRSASPSAGASPRKGSKGGSPASSRSTTTKATGS